MEQPKNKKKLGGYPAIGVVSSITLSLLVIGIFGILVMYSQELEHQVRQNIKVQVYLNANLTETQRLQIENKLLSQDYVSKENGRGIVYVSKDDAAKKFIEETGEDFISFIGENPLRDAYLVNIGREYHTMPEIERIKKEIQGMNGVFQVFYVEGLIESVNSNVTKIGLILLGLISILLLTVILLINNTLRIALFSQRFLIRSMQLVGARKWFIIRPFLLRASGYGFLAGLIAAGILWALSGYAQNKIQDLSLLHNQKQFIALLIVLMVTGTVIAILSTLFSIRRYLRMSLDQLY
ncbi:MAG: permease-like cell division protein FtsX [Cyclobacteriaceae bacterium]|nr:permease-like cell division protein FtsX [Cyclobacteriaceae bacterium]MDH4297118.1 permease-like cell division protein FtsX [Cyclobacteriaceae bacterium]MDH5251224.1 permease-like cell division protein FtsX [Cyclobacteriaceae bacterium]